MARRSLSDELDPNQDPLDIAPQKPEMGDLDVFEDETQEWRWRVYLVKSTEEIARNPRGLGEVWVTNLIGKVDLTDFYQRHGGGSYHFRGFLPGKRGIQEHRFIELQGPHKVPALAPDPPPPVAATQPSPPTNGAAPADPVLRYLKSFHRRLKKLEQPVTQPTPAPVQQGLSIREAIELIATFQGMARQNSGEKSAIKEMMEAVNLGIELSSNAGGGGKDVTQVLVEKAVPALERIVTAIATTRARAGAVPPRPVQARPVEAQAVVVDPSMAPPVAPTPEPPTAPPPAPEIETQAPWVVLIASLARAIENKREPEDFAPSIEDILGEDDLDTLKKTSAADVMAQLAIGGATVRYPVLASDHAKDYVEAVLAVLRAPYEEDES